MKPIDVIFRLWPFYIHLAFSWHGFFMRRVVGTYLAPTLYIGTETSEKNDLTIFLIIIAFFSISIRWKP